MRVAQIYTIMTTVWKLRLGRSAFFIYSKFGHFAARNVAIVPKENYG